MPSAKPQRKHRLPVALLPHEVGPRTWIQMVRTFGKLERRLELALTTQGLSLAQFDVLATLRAGEGITQQELAQRLLVTKGNVCGLIDRVESAGWVERRPDPNDRRANRLHLTRQGRDLLAAATPPHMALLKRAFGVFSAGEIQSFYQLLDRLESGIED
jgi:DNA-binding MarR family transcriptional regulator